MRRRECRRHRALETDRALCEAAPRAAVVLAAAGAPQRGHARRRSESDLRGRRLADAVRQVAPGQRRSDARGLDTGRHERAGAAEHYEFGQLHVHRGLVAGPDRFAGNGEGAM